MMQRLNDEELALKAADFPGASVLDDGEIQVVNRRPKRAEWRKFIEMTADGANRVVELTALFRATVVYPTLVELDKLFEADPVLETDLVSSYGRTVRKARDFEAKKLLPATRAPAPGYSTRATAFMRSRAAATRKRRKRAPCSSPSFLRSCVAPWGRRRRAATTIRKLGGPAAASGGPRAAEGRAGRDEAAKRPVRRGNDGRSARVRV